MVWRSIPIDQFASANGVAQVLESKAADIMRHLELARQATERSRLSKMMKGLATFVGGEASEGPSEEGKYTGAETRKNNTKRAHSGSFVSVKDPQELAHPADQEAEDRRLRDHPESNMRAAINSTFQRAAEVLKSSLDLSDGGVVFIELGNTHVDTVLSKEQKDPSAGDESPTVGKIHSGVSPDSGSKDSSRRKAMQHVLAVSMVQTAEEEVRLQPLDERTLQWITQCYPHGNLWFYDEEKCLDLLDKAEQANVPAPSMRFHSRNPETKDLGLFQGDLLLRNFPAARQILFLPLWDAHECKLLTHSTRRHVALTLE